jgi:hypothetical protein
VQPEAIRTKVLRELVSRMGADDLVTVDHNVFGALNLRGLSFPTVAAAIKDLVDLALLEPVADDLYRITHDGVMTIPGAPTERSQTWSQPMPFTPLDLERKEAARLRVLKAVYERANGNTQAFVPFDLVFKTAGLEWTEGNDALHFLSREGLLKGRAGHHVSIEHAGVKEYEAALKASATEGTEHFAAPVIVQIIHGNVGSIQNAGQGNTANVSQTVGVQSGDVVKLAEQLLEKAREHGDEDAIDMAQKAHVHATSGRLEKVKLFVQGLTSVAALVPYAKPVLDALANIGL